MGQFIKVLLAIDKVQTLPQMALDCGPGLGGIHQVYGPNSPTTFVRLSFANISTSLPDVQIRVKWQEIKYVKNICFLIYIKIITKYDYTIDYEFITVVPIIEQIN